MWFDDPPLLAEDPNWTDVTPLPQYEFANPVAPIFYSKQCKSHKIFCLTETLHRRYLDQDATDYFRGIVKTGEKSQRVLELTESIIRQNPAHYSAWCMAH